MPDAARHRDHAWAWLGLLTLALVLRLAEGFVGFAQASARPVSYVFFPMNAIQFGYSDLESAFRLQERLAGRLDVRVWEADPTIDGVLHLLDAAVAMRLHACIFALSQRVPVLGVDYYPGQGGKVEALFTDRGRPEDVRRLDTMETEWLVRRLGECTTAVPAR